MKSMEWYEKTVRDSSVNAVAAKAGLVQSTLSRQVRAEALTAETVVAIARAYGADVLDALVACGLITRDEIRAHGVKAALEDALEIELAAEVMRRAEGRRSPILESPIR